MEETKQKTLVKKYYEKLGSRILFITDKGLMSLGLTEANN